MSNREKRNVATCKGPAGELLHFSCNQQILAVVQGILHSQKYALVCLKDASFCIPALLLLCVS